MALAAEKVLNEEQKTAHNKEIEELRAAHAKELEDKDAFIQKQGHALQLWKAHETKHKERLQRKDATIAQLRLDLGPERAQARLEKQLFEDRAWRKRTNMLHHSLGGLVILQDLGLPKGPPARPKVPGSVGPSIPSGRNLTRPEQATSATPSSAATAASKEAFPQIQVLDFHFADSSFMSRPLPRSHLHLPQQVKRRPFPRLRFWTFVLQPLCL